MNQFIVVDLEVAIFSGNPLNGGEEIIFEGYSRAEFGSPVLGLFEGSWGITNDMPIIFPEAMEEWKNITHIVICVKHFEGVFLRVAPITAGATFFHANIDPLIIQNTPGWTVEAGSRLRYEPGSLLLYAGDLAIAMDHSGMSKFVN